MSSSHRRLTGFLDAVLHDRRPRRFAARPEDVDLMRAAMMLRAAHPASGEPAPAFVDDLARRLRARSAPPGSGGTRIHRRRFLQATGVAAAAAAAGVVGDRLIEQLSPELRSGAGGELIPENGRWVSVAAAGDVAPRRLLRFSAGSVEGVLLNRGGVISALSAICTHMGCTLRADERAERLVCPCHSATFSLDGMPSTADYQLAPLPAVRTRVVGGRVEVLVV